MTGKTGVLDSLQAARANGYAIVEQQLQSGVRGLAVPVKNRHGDVVAALSTNMPIEQETAEHAIQRVMTALQETALALMSVV